MGKIFIKSKILYSIKYDKFKFFENLKDANNFYNNKNTNQNNWICVDELQKKLVAEFRDKSEQKIYSGNRELCDIGHKEEGLIKIQEYLIGQISPGDIFHIRAMIDNYCNDYQLKQWEIQKKKIEKEEKSRLNKKIEKWMNV